MLPQEFEPRPQNSFLEDLRSSSLKLVGYLDAKKTTSINYFVSNNLGKPGERIIVDDCLESIPEAFPLSNFLNRTILTNIYSGELRDNEEANVILVDDQMFQEIKTDGDQIGYEVIANPNHTAAFISVRKLTRLLHLPATLDEKEDEKKTLEHVVERITEQLRTAFNKEQAIDSTKKGVAKAASLATIPLLMSVTIPFPPDKEPTSE